MENANRKKSSKGKVILGAIIVILLILWRAGVFDKFFGESKVGDVSGEKMSVHVIDVDQGNCVLIKAPEKTVLIDAGEEEHGPDICKYLKAQGVTVIDLMIATHMHSDHIGDMDYVIDNLDVRKVITCEIPESVTPNTPSWYHLLKAIKREGLELETVGRGEQYELGDGCVLEILGPVKPFEDYNENSVTGKVTYKNFSMMFSGDAGFEAENLLLAQGDDLSADVLIVGHHGSSFSTGDAYLAAVSPEFAVISCGVNNDYGHPHREIREKLAAANIKTYRTDLDGTVVFITDGEKIQLSVAGK